LRALNLGRVGQLALVVGMLAFGKPVLVPISLAFYLAFVLTPPSNWLERSGVPRSLSIAAVTASAIASVAVLGSALVAQAADLTRQMRSYSEQVSQKLSGLRAGKLGALDELTSAFSSLGRALDPTFDLAATRAPSVRLVTGGESTFQRLEAAFGPLLQPLGLAVLVFVMAIFMLGHREDLRGRLIQLVGTKNVTLATRTMAEAVNRVSHLLLTQAYINAAFGAVIAAGLYAIGTPYALLWGAIAGVLRFVPLLGALIATLLPTVVSFAVFPGYKAALLTIGLFLVVETLLSNFIEPMVLGKRTGVSALALLVSALFWTWLWGPAGLLLATPLTVCAAVVGRHVPELSFLAIALGDEPGLHADVNFYQRTLARATKDAYRLAKRHASETSLIDMFDQLMVPALGLMATDLNVGAISQPMAERVVKDVSEIVARFRAQPRTGESRATAPILGVAAESDSDLLLLQMLQMSLAEQRCELTTLPLSARAEASAAAIAAQPAMVCISALPAGGGANARFLCRKLRVALPDAYILVLLPESELSHSNEAAARLREAGANGAASSLGEATRLLVEQRALR
jgi:predicted PurR-regulated permease PerM